MPAVSLQARVGMEDLPMLERSIIGYGSVLSVAPGERIDFKISCEQPGDYEAAFVRLLGGDDPGGAGFREVPVDSEAEGRYPGRHQPTFPGSYAEVTDSEALPGVASFTLHAMVYATTPYKGRQALVGRWDDQACRGFVLMLADDGSAGLMLGDGTERILATSVPLEPGRWTMVAATFDAATGNATVYQQPLDGGAGRQLSTEPAHVSDRLPSPDDTEVPLRFAAWSGHEGRAGGFFNGKLDSVRWLDVALDREQLEGLREAESAEIAPRSIVGWWDFSRGIETEAIVDVGANGHHGTTHQLPTRAVTGWNWSGDEHRWRDAPEQYGAIHFHDDDLLDAAWSTDFSLDVPMDWDSGVYAARIRQGDPEGDEHVVFYVRPPRAGEYGRGQVACAFLVPTASYLAYANYRLRLKPNPLFGSGDPTCVNDAYLKQRPELGASLYDVHSDFSGIHFSSRHRPLTNMRPRQNRIWGLPADMNIIAWLENVGLDYEVITDEDLHEEGARLLGRYRAVLTGSHPEYYSSAMLDGVDEYLRDGGRWMYLGGNGFYWRIAFHPTQSGVIEVRRAEDGTRAWIAQPGEYYQAFDGEYGGLWRRIGRAPNQTVGVGFAAQGFERSAFYRRGPGADNPRARFAFEGVPDEIIGDFGSLGGGASGEEIDRYDRRLGSPAHALVLASATEHDEAMLRTKEEFLSTVPPFRDPKIRSDLVFFETANGGAVFSTGSIAWAGALAHENFTNNVARITENVLRRFADPTPFPPPEAYR